MQQILAAYNILNRFIDIGAGVCCGQESQVAYACANARPSDIPTAEFAS